PRPASCSPARWRVPSPGSRTPPASTPPPYLTARWSPPPPASYWREPGAPEASASALLPHSRTRGSRATCASPPRSFPSPDPPPRPGAPLPPPRHDLSGRRIPHVSERIDHHQARHHTPARQCDRKGTETGLHRLPHPKDLSPRGARPRPDRSFLYRIC